MGPVCVTINVMELSNRVQTMNLEGAPISTPSRSTEFRWIALVKRTSKAWSFSDGILRPLESSGLFRW
jgi:hypothetical protein